METGGPNRSGLCECGCGGKAPIARNTVPKNGWVRGQPVRFIRGHASRRQSHTFALNIERGAPDECWEWKGRVVADGKPRYGHRSQLAHRIAYERANGTLHPDDEVTQTCGNFLCMNPAHLALRRRDEPPPPNPSGICQCGCGEPAPLARQTDRRLGYVRGKPVRFIRGHVGRLHRISRITESYYTAEDRGYETPCWIWQRSRFASGYGRFTSSHRSVLAHRAMYEQEVGPIPEGWQIHHLCRQADCVCPDHLEAVTRSEHGRLSHELRLARRLAELSENDLVVIRHSTLSPDQIGKLLGLPADEITRIRHDGH